MMMMTVIQNMEKEKQKGEEKQKKVIWCHQLAVGGLPWVNEVWIIRNSPRPTGKFKLSTCEPFPSFYYMYIYM